MVHLLSLKLIGQAFVFLLVLYAWNVLGRYLQTLRAPEVSEERSVRHLKILAGTLQVMVLSAVMFLILIFVISGVVDNPTDFRYTDF